jgi:YbbR domain-containing protein
MPFQDIDESSATGIPRPPSAIERGLRKIFVEDWSLKLLALAITLVLWVAVTGENKPVTIRTAVQLTFIRPNDLDISNDPPKSVDVLLTGSRSKLNSISLLNLVATVDVSANRAGERVVRLSTDRVRIELPEGVKIESFQPSTIPIRLEPRVERQLEVEVRLEGKPAEGYEVYGTQPLRTAVAVRGPSSHIDPLQKAPTETISVEGKKASFTASHVAIDIPDHKVDVVDAIVDVAIEIGERRVEKSFSVRTTSGAGVQRGVATVTLSGPESVIAQLRQEDVKLVLDLSHSGATTPRLELPSAIQNQIKLVSIRPSQFSVAR